MDGNLLGRRIALLRNDRGWSQGQLAAKAAISRVALSHIEAGSRTASERTVVLIAGLLHVEPIDLVEGTSYPLAKSERLPPTAPRYTEAELGERLVALASGAEPLDVERWTKQVAEMIDASHDAADRERLRRLASALRELG